MYLKEKMPFWLVAGGEEDPNAHDAETLDLINGKVEPFKWGNVSI